MSVLSFSTAIPTTLREAETLSAPAWVEKFTGLPSPGPDKKQEDLCVGLRQSKSFTRIVVRAPRAAELEPEALIELSRRTYTLLFETLATASAGHPIRFWNFLPQVHEQIDHQQNRYMVFNAGRFLAFQNRYGDPEAFDRNVATASAVGHSGRDLWIHCVAASEPGVHLGNPRQVSPHRYSARFGNLPPCFARATLLATQSRLLIAGTASICGEESLHDDLGGQLKETLANLAAVVERGRSKLGCDLAGDPLRALTDVRIYHPRQSDFRWLSDQLRTRLGDRPRLEFVRADLCRPELLVEIEALADLTGYATEGALR